MRITKAIKNAFVAGLLLVLPLVITLVVFRFVFNWLLGLINPIVVNLEVASYFGNDALVAQVVTLVVLLATITVLGFLIQLNVGHRTFGEIGKVVNFLPLFRTVYTSVRQVANSFAEGTDTYESVVFVEYPRNGLYAIGFITGDGPGDLEQPAGEDVKNVYLPASPNPTNGKLAMVPESQVHESDLTVRQGIRLLMTTGTATTAEEMEELTGGGIDMPRDDDLPSPAD